MSASDTSLWGIILAGGEGERLKGFACEQFGSAIPKQFCTFVGRRSMLERTIKRARLLIPSERLVVIGTAHHSAHIVRHLGTTAPGTVLLQPANRDTAPGILLPLIHILRKDPTALVAILPADHFILPGHRFMRAVAAAARFVDQGNVDIPVLLAAKPDGPEPEYGWIELGAFVEHNGQQTIHELKQYVEKPPRNQAERLMQHGWLWNTMVIVVRAQALMDLAWKSVPDLARWFTLLKRVMGSPREQEFIEKVYEAIPNTNFSTSVLASRNLKSLVLPIRDVSWSDWGTKERILETTRAHGLRPSVPIRRPHDTMVIPV